MGSIRHRDWPELQGPCRRTAGHLEPPDAAGRAPHGRGDPQAALRRAWFSTALRSIGDAVIATDDRGRVLFLNPVAEALTGWPDGEAHGKDLAEVFPIVDEATGEPVEGPVAKVLATGRAAGLANHTVLIARDGKEVPIDDSAAPILDDRGRVAGVILVFRDVDREAARRAGERAAGGHRRVLRRHHRLEDLDGVITSWNRGAERILGYAAEEVIGRHVSMLMPPELVEDMPRILDRIRRGEKVDHYQTRRRRKDGTIIDVSLTVSPIRDASGRVIGASKIGRDITREKLVEAERLEAERRKDEFLAMLAHELRNPLSAINGAAQLFGKLETEEELEWAKEVVLRQVKHLARLIDDLLDVSRISRGKIGLRKEPIDLSPVVGSAVEAVRPLLEERKHELGVSLVNGGLRLEADPLRLEQILVNLLTNAAKYTDAGGRIALTARHEGADVVIKVRDTGMGIAPELLPRVFDLFAQGDRTMARSEGGLGIGLTLVQKLAEMHGGASPPRARAPAWGASSPSGCRPWRTRPPGSRARGRRCRASPAGLPRARRRRQPRQRPGARAAPEAPGARRPGGPRRPGRRRSGPGPPARGRAAGHRPAGHGRLRGRPAAAVGGVLPGRPRSSRCRATASRRTCAARRSRGSTTTW